MRENRIISKCLMILVGFVTYLELDAIKIQSGSVDMEKDVGIESNDESGNVQLFLALYYR